MPLIEKLAQRPQHVVDNGVEPLGPVHRHDPNRPATFEKKVVHFAESMQRAALSLADSSRYKLAVTLETHSAPTTIPPARYPRSGEFNNDEHR
jgi:hypothetical protein